MSITVCHNFLGTHSLKSLFKLTIQHINYFCIRVTFLHAINNLDTYATATKKYGHTSILFFS